jgi:hypothetical protein
MPRLIVETTPEREEEMQRRVLRSRAAVSDIEVGDRRERGHRNASEAKKAASRCGCPNTEVDAVHTRELGWVGIVRIRPDQEWMTRQIEERGCRAVVIQP